MKIDTSPMALHSGRGKRFAVAVSDFNAPVTERLLDSCLAIFRKAGVRETDLHVVRVPGAFELPLACLALARTKRYAAVVALGCVIRGETPHDRLAPENRVTAGRARLAKPYQMPGISRRVCRLYST